MSLQMAVGLDDAQLAELRQIRIGQNLSGGIAQSREALLLDNVDRRDDAATARIRRLGIRAYAGFPLLAHGELFGTIAFASTTQTAFTAADVEAAEDGHRPVLGRARAHAQLSRGCATARRAIAAP